MLKTAMSVSILAVAFSISQAQETTGIRFEQRLKWDAILSKARVEHKYIFVDCYATWCGPCEAMEKNVYPVEAVGGLYNKEFICVKLQMDRTPQDDDKVKSLYQTAETLEGAYGIKAYPTFLFFDPEGRPVHKAVGYKSEADFIRLAADAQNPKKQYYAILRNFRLGKLDTGEEKGLARSFMFIDRPLGGKLAFDYLRRIAKAQLGIWDNLGLMMIFGDNAQIKQLAADYIGRLPEKSFYDHTMLDFLAYFETTQGRGFKFIYDHPAEIDTIMHNPDWAQSTITNIIAKADFQPLLEAAQRNGKTADFDSIGSVLSAKYDAYYAARVIQDGKVKWFGWLVHEKNQPGYWPQLIQADIERLKRIWDDQQLRDFSARLVVNNTCYSDIFQHSYDSAQLNLAVRWIKELLQVATSDADALDTYACLLYKTGKVGEALQTEDLVLQYCIKYRERGTHTRLNHTTLAIQRMWNGEKIWEEKEFQE